MREDIPYISTGYADLLPTVQEQVQQEQITESVLLKRAIAKLREHQDRLRLIDTLDERDETLSLKEQIVINRAVSNEIENIIAILQPFDNQ